MVTADVADISYSAATATCGLCCLSNTADISSPATVKAAHGGRSFGKDGDDVIVDVPCGTVVYDAETGEYLTEVTDDGYK